MAPVPNINPVRGLYRASSGPSSGFAVVGQGVYSIDPQFQLTQVGYLPEPRSTPVSMIDNGLNLAIVDGSDTMYQVVLASGLFGPVPNPVGFFTGADRVDILDTFVVWNFPDTNLFGSTLAGTLTFDPTYFAAKAAYPDNIASLAVNRRELILIGTLKSEIFYNAGLPAFPFAEDPGAFFEHGCVAKYSVATQDISTFWLGQDLQGDGIVFRARGYDCRRVSTHAIEFALQQCKKQGPISDAIGYTYQQGGHVFYVLILPSALGGLGQTWVLDDSTEMWHQRAFTNADGQLERDRSNCCAFINGQNVVGDHSTGELFRLDPDIHIDVVAGVTYPVSCIRTFPHIGAGVTDQGQPVMADGKRLQFEQFLADIECGTAPLDVDGSPAKVSIRWSDDRGKTFGEDVLQSMGAPGEYLTQPQWPGLGIARDRIFELSYSINGPAALNGGWVKAKVLGS